jgi:hypothetical protein
VERAGLDRRVTVGPTDSKGDRHVG